MRRADKQQSEEIVALLKDSHILIKKVLDIPNYLVAMELLEQCQSSAIGLGEKIESTEGQDCPVISLIENYCEQIFQIYEKIKQGSWTSTDCRYDALAENLLQVENFIKHDIHIRREAVFLPYKASMWDSLESVWKAADTDPECDVYVIPIPYYDKNPDGTFGKYHYEGDLYPDYVPITHYEDYVFDKRRPDMIFIHNPYDEYNYLTSVHPFFYAKSLKQFTENLVYIPYFIMGEPNPNNEDEVKYISNFCITPGVIYADKVIVQSEKMRQVYIDVMTKFMIDHGFTRKDWEKKILGLGSPKTDKVLSTRREEQNIPEKWLRIIRKADGGFKKIVLYNTGLSAFLQHSVQYLDKMRDVFQIFREAKDDVALLWRPHPLLRNTIQTMRGSIAEDYERLLAKYCREGWGIYDDSAELNRAIAICDAYYGDGSSMVQLCEQAGKPIMIQDVNLLYYKRK